MEPRGRDGEPLRPATSTTGARQDIDSWKAQFGVDRILNGERDGSRLVAGLAFHYGKADTRLSSAMAGQRRHHRLRPDAHTHLVWRERRLCRRQAQANWFDSDLKSRSAGKLRNGAKAHGYRLGIEAGKAWDLRQGLALIPQAQLTYLSTRFGSFNDRFDARIESDKGDSLQGRVGIALDYKRDWQSGGVHREASVYGVANVKHEFLDGTRVRVANVPVASRMARTWGGLGLGVNYGWGGRYALYSQIDADADFSGSHVVTATVGFRMMF